jgi:hypothetical protein
MLHLHAGHAVVKTEAPVTAVNALQSAVGLAPNPNTSQLMFDTGHSRETLSQTPPSPIDLHICLVRTRCAQGSS